MFEGLQVRVGLLAAAAELLLLLPAAGQIPFELLQLALILLQSLMLQPQRHQVTTAQVHRGIELPPGFDGGLQALLLRLERRQSLLADGGQRLLGAGQIVAGLLVVS